MNIKIRLMIFVATVVSSGAGTGACAYEETDGWTRSKPSIPVVEGFSKEIIHRMNGNNIGAKPILLELSRRSNLIPITEKSVDHRKVTANYSDATVDEIAGGVLNQARLKSKLLTDNLIWIDPHESDAGIYRRDNCGNSDKAPPFSIEEQRLAKLRAESRLRQQQEAQAEAMREWKLQSGQNFEYYREGPSPLGVTVTPQRQPAGNYFVPPPPPTSPGFIQGIGSQP